MKMGICAKMAVLVITTGFVLLPLRATATSLSYTDLVQSPGDGITYSLDFSLVSGNTYKASFTISHAADTTPEWYASWFTFNFTTGSSAATISSLSSPSGTGPWSVLTSTTKVLSGGGNYTSPLDAGAAGFYVTSIAQGPPADNPTQGIWVTGPLATTTPETFTFNFTTSGGTLHIDDLPFKVGYYNQKTNGTKWIVNRLSAEAETSKVPEPGTLFLIGTGLLGLGFLRRRRS